MKLIARTLPFILLMSLLVTACKKDDDPTAKEVATKKLTAGTWTLQSVTIDGTDGMEFFPGLAVTFSGTAFTSANSTPVWPATGTWSFTNEEATQMVRDDGVQITINTLSDTQFECKLQWEETVLGGRSGALSGEHVFVFGK